METFIPQNDGKTEINWNTTLNLIKCLKQATGDMAKHLETETQKLRTEMDKKQGRKRLADLRKEMQKKWQNYVRNITRVHKE